MRSADLQEQGQGFMEYGMLIVLVVIVVMLLLKVYGGSVGNLFSNVVTSV